LRTEGKVADLKDKLANLAMKGDHIFGKDFRNVVGMLMQILDDNSINKQRGSEEAIYILNDMD